jgi:hypothetical protein
MPKLFILKCHATALGSSYQWLITIIKKKLSWYIKDLPAFFKASAP